MLLSTGGTIISAPINVVGGQGVKTILQAHLGNNMAATAFVSGNANTVYDTIGTGNWKLYVAAGNSIAAITSASNSSEWTGGSLLSYNAPDITSNLNMWYTMNADKNSSTTIYDSNGGPNATLNNGASIVSNNITPGPGPGNGDLSLNAVSSQYVTLPSITFSSNTGLTFALWVRSSGTGSFSHIFSSGKTNAVAADISNNIIIFIESNTLKVSVRLNQTGGDYNLSTGINANDNVWRHFVWTIDPTGIWNTYINGVKLTTKLDGVYPLLTTRTSNLIGKSNWSSDPYFNGGIDDFRIYNRTLTPTDISTLYSLPTIYYPFETSQVSGTTVGEYSTGDSVFNGTLSNGATIAVDAGSRVSGKGYLSLVKASGQYFSFRPISVTNSGLTIAMWFRATSLNTTGLHRLFDMRHSEISIQIGSSLDFIATTGSLTYGLSVINNNTWRHVAITIEYGGASGASSIYKMYINGNLETSVTRTFAYPDLGLRSTYNLGTFGNGNVGQENGSESFDGGIDDFRIYQRPISQAEVTDIYGGTTVAKITDTATGATWMPAPATPVDSTETGLYTVKSNEIALIPGTNSTYAVWTAPKTTNLKIDVSFADYHSRSVGVGFQMFKINNDNTFGSTLFNRTVTSTALTNANPSNYLTVPQINLSVVAGDKVVYRIDANGNTTSASSVLATTIYADQQTYVVNTSSYNPNETKLLQAHLGNNLAATTFVSGNANSVYDTVGTGNWKFYSAATTSVAAITSASASSEWTGGSLLFFSSPLQLYFPFETVDVIGNTVAEYSAGTAIYNGTLAGNTIATIVNETGNGRPGLGYLSLSAASSQYLKFPPITFYSNTGLTFSCWFRSNNTSLYGRLIDLGSPYSVGSPTDVSNNVIMYINPAEPSVYVAVRKNSLTAIITNTTASPANNNNTWRHIVWTISPTGTWNVYINGTINIANFAGVYPSLITRSSNYIGKSNWSSLGDPYFNGGIDDFRIYNRAITQTEVTAIYNGNANSTASLKIPIQLYSLTGATWMTTPATRVDISETLYTVKSNEIALTPGTNSTYAIWTAPKTTNLKIDVSFADYHSRSDGVGFQMFKINNNDTFGSILFNRTVTSTALTNAAPTNYLTVPQINLSVIAGDKVVYRIDANGNTTSASSVLATTIYADQQTYDFTQKIYQQANLANNLAATSFVVGNSNVVTDTIGTGNWNFYVAGGNSIAAITAASNSSEWTGGNLLSANDSFGRLIVQLYNGATYAADAGSRVAGKKYLKLTSPSNPTQFASILPFIPTTNGISFSFWIKISNITNTFIFNFRDANEVNQTFMGLFPNNSNFLGISNNSGEPDYTNISFTSIGDGSWHHIVWTMTYSATQTSIWKVYFDKTLNTTLTSKSYINIVTRTYHNIGTYDNSGDPTYALNAGIDNFKIYHKTLSDAEVIADYNDNFVGISELYYSVNPSPIWKLKPATAVDITETNYTVKSNEIALTPGTNSTYAVWTASKPSNIRLDVSFADYHSRNVGVGFQMFNIKSNNTFGSVLFNRTVTSAALTDINSSNYLTVPPTTLSVTAGEKIYIRVDANGNLTSASSVLAATIYTDSVSLAKNANETKLLQASLANNMAATTFVLGNANAVYDTVGTGNWKFYSAATTSAAAITSASNSSEWTGGNLLTYLTSDYTVFYPFKTNTQSGNTLLNAATYSYDATLYNGATTSNVAPVAPPPFPPSTGTGYLSIDKNTTDQYVQINKAMTVITNQTNISFWAKTNINNNTIPLFEMGDGTNFLRMTSGAFYTTNGNNWGILGYVANKWHHYFLRIAAARIYLFRDGGYIGDVNFGVPEFTSTYAYIGKSNYFTFTPTNFNFQMTNFVFFYSSVQPEIAAYFGGPSIHYYNFDTDSVSGINVANKVTGAYVNDAILYNGASISTTNGSPSPISTGAGYLNLQSTNQYLKTTSTIGSFFNPFAISFWAKSNSTLGTGARIKFFDYSQDVTSPNAGNNGFSMYLQNNEIHLLTYTNATGTAFTDRVAYTDSNILTDNIWRHYFWIVGSRLYINAVLVYTHSGGFTINNGINRKLYIGRDADTTNTACFTGGIDDFMLLIDGTNTGFEQTMKSLYSSSSGKLQDPNSSYPRWMPAPATPVDSSETSYTVKSNEIALIPGENSTYAIWTAPKSTNIRVDVSFADYHSRNVGVGFQMFKVNNDNTFGSILFNRTVTSTALTNAAPTNYLTVPPMNLSVAAGDKVVYRIDANGNPTSASSVLATNIYSYTGSWS